jgi:hypothetical protein
MSAAAYAKRLARTGMLVAAWCLVAAMPASLLRAATFADLYAVIVTPSPEAEDPQAEGVRLAMGQLLTRVTGRRDAGWDPELAGLVERAADYVDAVGFETTDQLLVRFNGRAVDRALTELNRPIWGPERPLTLIWLALDGLGGERAILSADPVDLGATPAMSELLAQLRQELRAAASERGLPITLPLLDLEDLNAIGFADIWGGFNDRIAAASSRYGADAWLIGKARVTEFGIAVQWSLVDGDRQRMVVGGAVRDGLDSLADFYAAEFATVGGTRAARITVSGLQSVDDYGRLMRYLENLSVLESVQVESLADGAVTLRLAARGDDAVLERLLSLSGVLRPDTTPRVQPFAGVLAFQLVH